MNDRRPTSPAELHVYSVKSRLTFGNFAQDLGAEPDEFGFGLLVSDSG